MILFCSRMFQIILPYHLPSDHRLSIQTNIGILGALMLAILTGSAWAIEGDDLIRSESVRESVPDSVDDAGKAWQAMISRPYRGRKTFTAPPKYFGGTDRKRASQGERGRGRGRVSE